MQHSLTSSESTNSTISPKYLEALHEANVANQDHTTLLLNCYTKLKNVQKLEQFIRSEGELNFDVETAIKVNLVLVCSGLLVLNFDFVWRGESYTHLGS